jgi:ubiquinone/menaquinone biosynthesis C-methylase UbiE
MQRVLEPELMDDEAQAAAYAAADFTASNQWLVDRLTDTLHPDVRTVADLGCGPADVLVRLARARPALQITGVDGSAPMIRLAREAVRIAGHADRVVLLQARIPAILLDAHTFDAVVSKDLLHHLPDPAVLWAEVKRLGRPGAAVFVMDLIRPETPEAAERVVEGVATGEPDVLKRDFFNSLCAAFTVDEVVEQIGRAGLDLRAARVSDRHWLAEGRLP